MKRRPVTIEEAQKLVAMLDVRVSPDGALVAFVESLAREDEKTRAESIWSVPTAGGKVAQLTQGPDDGQPRWSPDGQTLAFVRKTEKEKPPQVHLLPRAGGEPSKLTELEMAPEAVEFVPGGRRLSFLAPTPDDKKTKQRKEQGDDARVFVKDDRSKRVWTASLGTGKATPCSPEDLAIWEYDWLPDGKRAAVIFTEEPRLDALYFTPKIGILDASTSTVAGLDVNFRFAWALRISPDGALIAVCGGVDDTPHGYLAWVVDTRTGEAQCMTPGLPGSVGWLEWLPDASGLLLMVEEGVFSRLYTVPVGAPGELQRVYEELPGQIDGLRISGDGGALFAAAQDLRHGPEVWRADAESGKATKLTSVNGRVAGLRLGRSDIVKWRSTEDLDIEGILTLPPNFRRGRPRPTILLVHGGPASRFRGDLGLFPRQLLANEGYVVLAPNPRGSAGYGSDFVRANIEDWGGGDLRDLLSGLDMLVEEGIADPERLGIYGASYGGYMTAWTVTQTNRFKAAVCQCGLTNLFSFHGQTDITPNFLTLYFGASPYEDPERYRAHSAMTFIKQAKTPTLFLHGEQDVRVPIPQSYEMYWGLRHFGVDTEFVIYPREGHGIMETPHNRDLMQRVVEWFGKYVK